MFLPKLTTDLFSTNGFTTPLSFQILYQNRPFPSFPGPLFQNEGRCSAFDMEIIFHSHANKTRFHKKGCAPGLVFKKVLVYTYRFHCFRLSTCIRSRTGMDIGLKLFSKIFLCSFELNCLIRKFVLTSNSFASWFNISEPPRPVKSFYVWIFGFGKSSRTYFVLI